MSREGWLAFAKDATLAKAQRKGSRIHQEGERRKGTRGEECGLSISQMSRSFADFRNTQFRQLFAESVLVASRRFAAKWFRRFSQGRRDSSQFAVRRSQVRSSQFASSQISQVVNITNFAVASFAGFAGFGGLLSSQFAVAGFALFTVRSRRVCCCRVRSRRQKIRKVSSYRLAEDVCTEEGLQLKDSSSSEGKWGCVVWWGKGAKFSVCQLPEGGAYGTRLWRGGMLCYSPSSLGEATWPHRGASSPRDLSAASYRLCSTSRAIWRHSALFPLADTVRSWAQHVREGKGSGAEIHRSPSVQARMLQPVKEGRQLASDAECLRERWWLRRRSSVFAGGVVCLQGNRMCSRDAPDQDGREMQRGSH
ncbi:hypothetical protein C8Q73DRAFT_669474 [Cubamyces lactineus]|nr:hypothetical protein C8Q73DRAFT_669474 [Cubamyces lactineus]